jgi:hypothetical protein
METFNSTRQRGEWRLETKTSAITVHYWNCHLKIYKMDALCPGKEINNISYFEVKALC